MLSLHEHTGAFKQALDISAVYEGQWNGFTSTAHNAADQGYCNDS